MSVLIHNFALVSPLQEIDVMHAVIFFYGLPVIYLTHLCYHHLYEG